MKTESMKENCDDLNGDERKRRSEEGEKSKSKRHGDVRKRHSEEGEKSKRKRLSEEDEKNERKKRYRKEGKGMVEVKSEKSQRKDQHHHSGDNRSSNSGKYDKKTRERGKGLEKHESKHNREEEKRQRRKSKNNDELGCYQSSSSGLKENKSDDWIPCMDMELGLDRWNPRVDKHAMEWEYKGVKSQGTDFAEADNMKKSTELEEKSPTPTLSDVENSTKYDSRVYEKLKIASDVEVGKPSWTQFQGTVPSIQRGQKFPFPSNIQRGGNGRNRI